MSSHAVRGERPLLIRHIETLNHRAFIAAVPIVEGFAACGL